jgi:hypothetical protein
VKPAAITLLVLVFLAGLAAGYWQAGAWRNNTWQCTGSRLAGNGVLYTNDKALAAPGRMVITFDDDGDAHLVSRDLLDICEQVLR